MMRGYGDILRVDLTRGEVQREPLSPDLVSRFVGGEGINDWLLWEHFLRADPRCDPTGEENVLIAGVGPLGGAGLGLGTKMKWTFKGPAYEMFGDSVSGGTFAPHLRWAGYDYLVVTGRAREPVYLWIDDDRVELRPAGPLWGKGAFETADLIRRDLGDGEIGVACVGPAGENRVTFASITVTESRSAGRAGGGCIMGSKNLKAIAARGTRGLSVHDPRAFMEVAQEIADRLGGDPQGFDFKKSGTLSVVNFYHAIGGNAYRNNQGSTVPEERIDPLRPQWFDRHLKTHDLACSPGCSLACNQWYRVRGNETPLAARYAGEAGEGPEYLTVAAFGMGCDVPDYTAISHFHRRCNDYSMDLCEAGSIVAFLMELWQRGVIGERESRRWFGRPLSLEWGNVEAVEEVLRSMAHQENEGGRILRRGMYRAAEEIERLTETPAKPYLVCGKGGAAFPEELRPFPIWMVNMAVASRGADHLKGVTMMDKAERKDLAEAWLGSPKAGEGFVPDMKGIAAAFCENRAAAVNLLGICTFLPSTQPLQVTLGLLAQAYRAMTGVEMTEAELLRCGERAYNLEKAFNSRLGLRRNDDRVCQRWLEEPATWGTGRGMKAQDYLEGLLDEYYRYRGWDVQTSLQTRRKLEELGLEGVAEVLARESALA